MAFHRELGDNQIHVIFDQTYNNNNSRDNDTAWNGLSENVGKCVFVSNTNGVHMLLSTSPSWFDFGGSVSTPDTIYTADGDLAGSRQITGPSALTLTLQTLDLLASTYTTGAELDLTSTAAEISAFTGSGAGTKALISRIQINQSSMQVLDQINSKGLVYGADYSTNFTDRSIVDKAYVDGAITDGPVHGPVSSQDNTLAIWDGTGGDLLKSSAKLAVVIAGDGVDFDLTPGLSTAGGEIAIKLSTGFPGVALFRDSNTSASTLQSFIGDLAFEAAVGSTIDFINRGTNANEVATFETVGTNPGNTRIYVGLSDPTGTITADPASLYIRDAGVNASMFIHRDSAASNTGWQTVLSNDQAVAPVAGSLVTFTDTTGAEVTAQPHLTFIDSGASLPDSCLLDVISPHAGGWAEIRIHESGGTHRLAMTHDDFGDNNSIQSYSPNPFDILSAAGHIRFDLDISLTTATNEAAVELYSPSAAGIIGLEFYDDATTDLRGRLTYIESLDQVTLWAGGDMDISCGDFDVLSGTNALIRTNHITGIIEFDASGTLHVNPAIKFIQGEYEAPIYINNVAPGGVITANPGSVCFVENGTSSSIYVHQGAAASNTDWSELLTDSTGIAPPGTVTDDAIVLWDGTTGNAVKEAARVRIEETTGLTTLGFYPTVTADATLLAIHDSNGATAFRIRRQTDTGTTFLDNDIGAIELRQLTSGSALTISTLDAALTLDSGAALALNSTTNTNINAGGRLNVNVPASANQQVVRFTNTTLSAESDLYVETDNPNGSVNASGGALVIRDDGAKSELYINKEATTGNDEWYQVSINPPDIIEIHNATELAALATANVITISANTVFVLKANVTTLVRFEIENNVTLYFVNPPQSDYNYAGTGTLFSGNGVINISDTTFVAYAGGTFMSLVTNNDKEVVLRDVLVGGFKLGSITKDTDNARGPAFTMQNVRFFGWNSTLVLTDIILLAADNFTAFQPNEVPRNIPCINIKSTVPWIAPQFSFQRTQGSLIGTETLVEVDSGISKDTRVQVTASPILGNTLFETASTATGVIASVADASHLSTAITTVIDSGGDARFAITAVGATIEVGQWVVHSGFTTNTDYNGDFIVTATTGHTYTASPFGPGGDAVAFGSNEAGTLDTNSVEITDTAHGLVEGDSLSINTDASGDYDGGYQVLSGETANTFRINAVWTQTRTGTWSNGGLDQSDPHVLTSGNPSYGDSQYIATAYVNDNGTNHGSITNNTFKDCVFGTGGSALVAGSTMERWKLVDDVAGVFEYTGLEPFDGSITFNFTSVSSGGSQEFRFKWAIDTGSGFGNLPDDVEVLQEIGSDAANMSKTFPLHAQKGYQIKPQVTRNTGGSNLTTSYATIYVQSA